MANHSTLHPLTTQDFDERTKTGTWILDFWAEWCGPCRQLTPVLEQLASEHPGTAFGAVDVDAEPELAQRFGVMSIPTVVVLVEGEVAHRMVGGRGLAQLRDEFGRWLA